MVKRTQIALQNVGKIDPTQCEDYIQTGGYEALKKAVQLDPVFLLNEVKDSGLRGRGGAGFPTGLKEQFTRDASSDCQEVFVVCNADEGEPGTFKDRIIMEHDPHRLLEGMLLAGFIVGSNKGYIYIRGEYNQSIEMMRKAIDQAREQGFLGNAILGSDFSFDIEIALGAGSYLCGEELTLIESLEGKRGYPRIKPPFPAEKGFLSLPTLVNNVETLSHLPSIIQNGAGWYTSLGTVDSPGTKIFTISGKVKNPGYAEVEMGLTLGELIHDVAGGMSDGLEFKGALLGGAAGTFVDSSFVDVPLAYETLKEKGATLGSGAVIVLSNEDNVRDLLLSTLDFFKHESCGKCVPCRIGTAQLLELAKDLEGNPDTADRLVEEARYMAATSLCPLGQSPILPIESAGKYFKNELMGE